MIEELATVVETDGNTMSVEIERQSSCGFCSARSGCGTNLIASLFGRQRTLLSLPNSVHARTGDRVVLGIRENDLLKGSLQLYLWPLAGLLVGASAGHLLTGMEPIAILGGLTGMFLVLKILKRRQVTPAIEVLRREHALRIEPAQLHER